MGVYNDIDANIYANPRFNSRQMEEIRLMLKWISNNPNHNLGDISKYITPEFNSDQLREIRAGIERGLTIVWYAKPVFNSNQMYEIRKGLEHNLPVMHYAKPELSWEEMERIRVDLESGNVNKYNYSRYNEFGSIIDKLRIR